MSKITFRTHDAFLAFQNMSECMWVNARDDSDAERQSRLDALHLNLNRAWMTTGADIDGSHYPIALTIHDVEMANTVLENCLDDDEANAEDFIGIGNCYIE